MKYLTLVLALLLAAPPAAWAGNTRKVPAAAAASSIDASDVEVYSTQASFGSCASEARTNIFCSMLRDDYDVEEGWTITPNPTDNGHQVIELDFQGARLYSSETDTVANTDILRIDTVNLAHGYDLIIRNLIIDGSSSTLDERGLNIDDSGSGGNGRVWLDNVVIGSDSSLYDITSTETGGHGARFENVGHIYWSNGYIYADGEVLDFDGDHGTFRLSFKDSFFQGETTVLTDRTLAGNPCIDMSGSAPTTNLEKQGVLDLDGSYFNACGGFILGTNVVKGSVTLGSIGAASADEELVNFDEGVEQFDLKLNLSNWATGSNGSFFESDFAFVGRAPMFHVRIMDQQCQWMASGNRELIESDGTSHVGPQEMVFTVLGGNPTCTGIDSIVLQGDTLVAQRSDEARTAILTVNSGIDLGPHKTLGHCGNWKEGADDGGHKVELCVPDAGGLTADQTDDFATSDCGDGSEMCFPRAIMQTADCHPIVIESIAATDDFLFEKAPHALTITDIHCIIDPADTGDSANIEVFECNSTGDSCATVDAAITCDNDGAEDDGTLSNPSIDAGDWLQIQSGACTGTCDFTTISVCFTRD